MNTAKTLQLLDVQSNNISPATNIESIYYEVMDGGVIYRNSIYRHFPIYVNYNNNIDEPINVNRTTAYNGSLVNVSVGESVGDIKKDISIWNTSTFRLTTGTNKNDILLSSIAQTHLKNTRYYKLDVTTYNFSDIMSLYAPKLWVSNKFNSIDSSINNIKYDSPIITKYSINPYSAFIRTTSDVGNLEKESSGDDLNGKRINDLLDKILFKKEYPYIYDASIYMDKTESSVQLNINNIIDLKDIGEKDAEAEYNIFVNNGKLKIVYHQVDSLLNDPASNLNIYISPTNKDVSLYACFEFYNNKILSIYNNLRKSYSSTPNNDNNTTWRNFENNIITLFKGAFRNYISESYFDNINWQKDVIPLIYEDKENLSKYPRKNQSIKSLYKYNSDTTKYESSPLRNMLDQIFGREMLKNSYFKIIDNPVTITTQDFMDLQLNPDAATYDDVEVTRKTNYGEPITDADVYIEKVYINYKLSYNDYMHPIDYILLQKKLESAGISNNKTLLHKVNVYMPIFINNKIYQVSGIKEQYIEFIQNTAEDTIIYIPKMIDNSDLVNNRYLPELYAISQGGIFMPANNWVISSINDKDTVKNILYPNINTLSPTQQKNLSGIMNMVNIYVIKAQKSYDNNTISCKRTIKIKIHTTIELETIIDDKNITIKI